MVQSSNYKNEDRLKSFLDLASDFFKELYSGIRKGTFPWPICLLLSAVISIFFALRWDAFLWRVCHLSKLYPFPAFLYWPYFALYVTSPIWIWTFSRVVAKRQLIKKLSSVFQNAGLQTRTGRLPGFIADESMDTHMRKLVLSSVGIPEAEFKRARPYLETELQVFIDQIKSRVERGTVELLYAHNPIPEQFLYDTAMKVERLEFMVGATRSTPLYVSLRDVPHLLIAGYTNSGKSAFLRQFLTTVVLNNERTEFTLVDLKRGLELGLFDGLPNVRLYTTPPEAIEALKYVESQLEKRMAFLKANKCSDFDALVKKPLQDRVSTPEWPKDKKFVRHVVVIDEAAELFLASATLASKDAQVAKRLAAKVAALGRAVGIHIAIATQRPDRNAVDPLIKSNLQGRLCFQMADNASSMTILDSVRAADLPPTKGRAIWRSGFDLIEVQVPWLDREQVEAILKPIKEKYSKESNPAQAISSEEGNKTQTIDEIAILDAAKKIGATESDHAMSDGISS